ncbi:unnamed protein product [Dovyalis caffra]|uniref:Uncharacterized protein n=1 Tax=Dovyalis caffra TaxID=77055 RepID=A0AAV1SKH2_9ROSI|nr:unnamed protein product [Dovyalis caffra]
MCNASIHTISTSIPTFSGSRSAPAIPLSSLPTLTNSPSPPSPDDGGELRERHRENHHHRESIEEDCCKWLEALDIECVCGLLHNHLPVFLSKPAHEYTLYVSGSCNITYACDGKNV